MLGKVADQSTWCKHVNSLQNKSSLGGLAKRPGKPSVVTSNRCRKAHSLLCFRARPNGLGESYANKPPPGQQAMGIFLLQSDQGSESGPTLGSPWA